MVDTSILIDWIRARRAQNRTVQHQIFRSILEETQGEQPLMSSYTAYELARGDSADTDLPLLDSLIQTVPLRPSILKVATTYYRSLQGIKKAPRFGEIDLLIAADATDLGATLLTADLLQASMGGVPPTSLHRTVYFAGTKLPAPPKAPARR